MNSTKHMVQYPFACILSFFVITIIKFALTYFKCTRMYTNDYNFAQMLIFQIVKYPLASSCEHKLARWHLWRANENFFLFKYIHKPIPFWMNRNLDFWSMIFLKLYCKKPFNAMACMSTLASKGCWKEFRHVVMHLCRSEREKCIS